MSNTLSTSTDLVNAALINIGVKRQIGHMYDGSDEANAALAVYGQTRDLLIRTGDWQFATRNRALVLLKTAPTFYAAGWTDAYPPQGWLYEYEYPEDMVKLRILKRTAVLIPDFDPNPTSWSIYNDTSYDPPKRTILSNVTDAIGVFAGQITDPLTWPVDFAQALIDALGVALATALADPQSIAVEATEGVKDTNAAKMEQG